jgi:uncharacterized membrane protein YidH (DUF202 family)
LITRDSGLQSDRTILAWKRTILLLVINIFLLFRAALVNDTFIGMVAALTGIFIISIIPILYFLRRYQLISNELNKIKPPNNLLVKTTVFTVIGLTASTLSLVVAN